MWPQRCLYLDFCCHDQDVKAVVTHSTGPELLILEPLHIHRHCPPIRCRAIWNTTRQSRTESDRNSDRARQTQQVTRPHAQHKEWLGERRGAWSLQELRGGSKCGFYLSHSSGKNPQNVLRCSLLFGRVQGHLAHKKTPTPLAPP